MPVKTHHWALAYPLCPQVWTDASTGKSESGLFLSTWTREPHVPFPGFHGSFVLISFQEPFGEIDSRYKVDLNPENAKLLSTFLNHIGLEAFLLDLHEMMILKLKNPKTTENFNPEWRYGLASTQAYTRCRARHTQHFSTSSNIFHKHENFNAELGFLMIYHYQLQESYILIMTSRITMSERCAF